MIYEFTQSNKSSNNLSLSKKKVYWFCAMPIRSTKLVDASKNSIYNIYIRLRGQGKLRQETKYISLKVPKIKLIK